MAQLSDEHNLYGFYMNFIQPTSRNSNKFLPGYEICVSIYRPYLAGKSSQKGLCHIVSNTECFDKDSNH